ncbi:MAG: Vat family streptogramin A O-acetyltransferase [Spirochaetales bacterium]|uniref:Vat family streptogramin A O-acetyltransferase n=1 Tax=Candidatus Thalassospirochaeta sargassi TaxID=3119039 RepID=A0AAJ1IGS7_9SPIO|nr:Vat family streptogramin A O-acetyltransferase [Spirochaetales bacterium]
MNGPKPTDPHPMKGFNQICYLNNIIKNPNIIIGDYTYYDDPINSEEFEKNVLYHFPFIGDKLIIGKFCAIAHKTKFIMNGANHKTNCFSTYPFQIFGNGWEKVTPELAELPNKGDTIIENDVWIGYDSLIMPGVHIGNGAIIASKSVVVNDVEPYTIVGGNPATVIKKRFSDDIISLLLELKWWDWDAEKISENLEILTSMDLEKLKSK